MRLGKKKWVIPEGYIPAPGPFPGNPALRSHETAAILNTQNEPAHLEIHVFFADRDPVGPYHVVVPAQRTLHLRFDELVDPKPIPRETDYSSLIVASLPVIVQHTRLDARTGALALLSTLAYSED